MKVRVTFTPGFSTELTGTTWEADTTLLHLAAPSQGGKWFIDLTWVDASSNEVPGYNRLAWVDALLVEETMQPLSDKLTIIFGDQIMAVIKEDEEAGLIPAGILSLADLDATSYVTRAQVPFPSGSPQWKAVLEYVSECLQHPEG